MATITTGKWEGGPKVPFDTTNGLSIVKHLNPSVGEVPTARFNMDGSHSRWLADKETGVVWWSDYHNKPYGWLITIGVKDIIEPCTFDLGAWLKTAKNQGMLWNGQPIMINVVGKIYSTSAAKPAITISPPNINGITSYKHYPVLYIAKDAEVYGHGGAGGDGTDADGRGGIIAGKNAKDGQPGGVGIKLLCPTVFQNYGDVFGGAGGGGGGGSNFHRVGKNWWEGCGGGGGAPFGTGGACGDRNAEKGKASLSLKSGGAGGNATWANSKKIANSRGGNGGSITEIKDKNGDRTGWKVNSGAQGIVHTGHYWYRVGRVGDGGVAGASIQGTIYMTSGNGLSSYLGKCWGSQLSQ